MKSIGIVIISIICLHGQLTEAAVYIYIGCFADNSVSPDLTGPSSSLSNANVTADSCLADCQKRGYAYAGLQGGNNMCYCGTSYGYYGPSTSGCGMACGEKECGNLNSNSIYYTADTNATVVSSRQVIYVGLTQPYVAARMDCLAHNGDLIAFDKSKANETAEVVRSQTSKVTKVWVGLRKNDTSEKYEWVNPTISKYDINSDASVEWKQEQVSSACVLFDVNSLKFESAPCNVPFAYLCRSLPWSEPVPYTPSTPTSGNSKLVLFIILPIFLLCYGGSCLIYCIHKAFKHCRGRKHAKMPLYGNKDLSAPIPVFFPPPFQKSVDHSEDSERFKNGPPIYIHTNPDDEDKGMKVANFEMKAAGPAEILKGDMYTAQRRLLGSQLKV